MTPEERLKLIQSRCTEDGPCWLWLGATDGHGRGQMRIDGRTTYVRRVVRALVDDAPVPAKRVVASRCGNKGCVSPECSVVATHKQKAQLGAQRGAYTNIKKTVKAMVTKRAKSRYSDELVHQIRNAPPPAARISLETGVSISHVKSIRRGAARRDLSNPFAGLGARV